ncbi:MAG: SAM-dependent chlorinase/fluorinase [Candidatus Electrothrix sp. GW3-4]|uniref:SAM hydrolase/SAM-dependent halogenase family protein n=1 Tax=Candidatus Electrothrix sp. GW3-4 TaxID=3126740 RepID=UPI0030CF1437
MQPSGIISLTTDFGLRNPYVGQMKGAILRRNPAVRLVDLSHTVARQDIAEAAIVLHSSYAFFPSDTVHLVVVDPGVGSHRRILVAEGDEQIFVAPDNGVLSLLLRDGLLNRVYCVEQRELFAEAISPTFHGRDIMGPVAATLAGGLALAAVGSESSLASCVCLDLPVARVSETKVEGEVLQIDHFGNIRTTICSTDLEHLACPQRCWVQMNEFVIQGISTTYAETGPGKLIALLDSADYLEIAVNMGSAAEQTQCRIGDPVQIDCPK